MYIVVFTNFSISEYKNICIFIITKTYIVKFMILTFQDFRFYKMKNYKYLEKIKSVRLVPQISNL